MPKFWIAFISVTFVSSLAFFLALIISGTGDPALSKVPDYYEQGLAWDGTQAERAASEALGWSATWAVTPDDEGCTVRIEFRDRNGDPVVGDVFAEGFHNADPTSLVPITLVDSGEGIFEGRIERPRVGWWRIGARVTAGDDRFITEERLFLAPSLVSAAPRDRETAPPARDGESG